MERSNGGKTESDQWWIWNGISSSVAWYPRAQGGEHEVEGSRTRCKSIEFDPIDQAADSLPVITRGRRSIARINHLAFDRLSIPIFPRGIGYLGCSIFGRQGPRFILPLQLVYRGSSISLSRYIYLRNRVKCLGLAFFFFFFFFLSLFSCFCLSRFFFHQRDSDIFLVAGW